MPLQSLEATESEKPCSGSVSGLSVQGGAGVYRRVSEGSTAPCSIWPDSVMGPAGQGSGLHPGDARSSVLCPSEGT